MKPIRKTNIPYDGYPLCIFPLSITIVSSLISAINTDFRTHQMRCLLWTLCLRAPVQPPLAAFWDPASKSSLCMYLDHILYLDHTPGP